MDMKKPTLLVQQAEEFVFRHVRDRLSSQYTFHNYRRCQEVADAAKEIAEGSGLGRDETEIVVLAAWFHCTGIAVQYHDFEVHSKRIAEEFLKTQSCSTVMIEQVMACIDATSKQQRPDHMLAHVLYDALNQWLSAKKFTKLAALWRYERERVANERFSDPEWLTLLEEKLLQTRYQTPYAHLHFERRKTQNLLLLQQQKLEMKGSTPRLNEAGQLATAPQDKAADNDVHSHSITISLASLTWQQRQIARNDWKAGWLFVLATLLFGGSFFFLPDQFSDFKPSHWPAAIVAGTSFLVMLFVMRVWWPVRRLAPERALVDKDSLERKGKEEGSAQLPSKIVDALPQWLRNQHRAWRWQRSWFIAAMVSFVVGLAVAGGVVIYLGLTAS